MPMRRSLNTSTPFAPKRTVVLQRETATRNGKDLDVIAAVDFEIHRGKITEVTVYQGDTYQFDESWEDG